MVCWDVADSAHCGGESGRWTCLPLLLWNEDEVLLLDECRIFNFRARSCRGTRATLEKWGAFEGSQFVELLWQVCLCTFHLSARL